MGRQSLGESVEANVQLNANTTASAVLARELASEQVTSPQVRVLPKSARFRDSASVTCRKTQMFAELHKHKDVCSCGTAG